jgi:hypothetical protein
MDDELKERQKIAERVEAIAVSTERLTRRLDSWNNGFSKRDNRANHVFTRDMEEISKKADEIASSLRELVLEFKRIDDGTT